MPAGIGTVAAIAIGGWILSMIWGGDEGGGTTDVPGGGSGGGGKGGGNTTPKVPKKPAGGVVPANVPKNPAHLGGGGVWGDASKIPADFDWSGNGWWISNDCDAIAVGAAFAPESYDKIPFDVGETIVTLQRVTEVGSPPPRTGTLWNFLYYTGDENEQPEEKAHRVLREMSLFCSELPAESWPAPLGDFFAALVADVVVWWESEIGVEFE